MQVSFHKYGDNFFPGTGAQGDVGHSSGKGYSINVPLREGMDDESYKFMYEPIMKKVMAVRSFHCLLPVCSLLIPAAFAALASSSALEWPALLIALLRTWHKAGHCGLIHGIMQCAVSTDCL